MTIEEAMMRRGIIHAHLDKMMDLQEEMLQALIRNDYEIVLRKIILITDRLKVVTQEVVKLSNLDVN